MPSCWLAQAADNGAVRLAGLAGLALPRHGRIIAIAPLTARTRPDLHRLGLVPLPARGMDA